jgi:hypothetical protein
MHDARFWRGGSSLDSSPEGIAAQGYLHHPGRNVMTFRTSRVAWECRFQEPLRLDGRPFLGYPAAMTFERIAHKDAIERSARFLALKQLLEAAVSDPRRITVDEVKGHLTAKRAELAKQGL